MRRPAFRVLAPGPSATIQDLGRPGWFSCGVGVAGAADTVSHRLANALVGNDELAATVECVLGGLQLKALAPIAVAITGAPAPITVDGAEAPHSTLLELAEGQELRLGLATVGMRVYLAVRGGVAAEPVLGSRSRDTMAGVGPDPLQAGDEFRVGPAPLTSPGPVAPARRLTMDPLRVRVALGPRDDWFARPTDLFTSHWTVSDRLDRVGVRLDRPAGAPPLTRLTTDELASEGVATGSIQVPPSGEPVVFLADHPITGGYPVIGVVLTDDIPLLAQARPGQQVLFRDAAGSADPAPRSLTAADLGSIGLRGHPSSIEIAAILAALSVAAATPSGRL